VGLFSSSAHSQESTAPAAQAPGEELQQIVVTGTHIGRRGFQEPTPTTVVDSTLLEDRAPSVLVDALKSLPQFRNVATPSTAGLSTASTGGQSFVDLRGLGPNRSLVLLNGQRLVPTTSIETVDVALLPQALINRVDVVTGGASAVYGSDAVSGVANFVLDTTYEGLRGDAGGGISSRGDAGERKASLVWGSKFADRLHVIASGEYYKNNGLDPLARDFHTPYGIASNPAFQPGNGQAPLLLTDNFYFPNATFGGLIVGGPLANTQFLPGGTTAPYTPCPQTTSYQLCDSPRDLPWLHFVTLLASPQERATGYTRLTFSATPGLSLYADALYAESETAWNILPPTTNLNGLLTIRNDNAFLPASVREQMTTLGLPSFQLGRTFADFGPAPSTKDASVYRFSGGIDAALGERWKADGYLSYGRSELITTIGHTINMPLLRRAIDSVVSPVSGQPVCRSTLTNPADGCVPVNIFGAGSPSAAAIASFAGDEIIDLVTRQLAVGANLSTEPFSTWAGPAALAFGGEYRAEDVDQTVDPISAADGWAYNNPKPLSGDIDVKEAYVETVVPLARGLAFAQNIELNAGARLTDYSTSGTVTTWKAGANYAPVDDLHFRATRSRDIRAPNVVELNSPAFQVTAGDPVVDPRNNASLLVPRWTSGNNALDPEIASTLSFGIVTQPRFLTGFSGSLDFYRVRVSEAISTLTSQEILNGCQAGNAALCALILRDGTGSPTRVTSAYLNLAQITTSGFDLELEYRREMLGGNTTFRALGNYLKEYVVDNGASKIDYAGDIGTLNLAKWGWDLSAQYRRGPWSWLVDTSYIGAGKYRNTLEGLLANNRVKEVWYVNTAVSRDLEFGTTRVRASLNLDNVFDQEPPFGFGNGGNTGLSGGSYNRVGRLVKLGFRVEL
jgi:outer membrane receptor protein involved in Fe transport